MPLIILLAACAEKQESGQKYFDFEAMIDEQVDQLRQRGRVLEKATAMGVVQTDSTFLPSGKGWEAELEIFRDLEIINRPAFRKVYQLRDPIEDSNSNLKIREYVTDKAPLRLLRFYYHDKFERLKKIEGFITEKNYLYTTCRTLTMEFEEEEDKPQLIRYAMTGFQKMLLGDTVRFSVQGQIDW